MAGFIDRVKGAAKGLLKGFRDSALSTLIPGYDMVKNAIKGALEGDTPTDKGVIRESSPAPVNAPPAPAVAPAPQQVVKTSYRGYSAPPPLSDPHRYVKGVTEKGTQIYSTNPHSHMEVKNGMVETACPVKANGEMMQIAKVKVPQSVYDNGGGTIISPDGRSVTVQATKDGPSQTVNIPPGHFQNGGTVEVGKDGKPVALDREGKAVQQPDRQQAAGLMKRFNQTTQDGQGAKKDTQDPARSAPSQTPQNPTTQPQKQTAAAR